MEVGIEVMAELCQIVLHVLGMANEWVLGIEVSIFNKKDYIKNFYYHRAMKLFYHGMKD